MWGWYTPTLFSGTPPPLSLYRKTSVPSGKFPPPLGALFDHQLCCAPSQDSRYCCLARLTGDQNPSPIDDGHFPDGTLAAFRTVKNPPDFTGSNRLRKSGCPVRRIVVNVAAGTRVVFSLTKTPQVRILLEAVAS